MLAIKDSRRVQPLLLKIYEENNIKDYFNFLKDLNTSMSFNELKSSSKKMIINAEDILNNKGEEQ